MKRREFLKVAGAGAIALSAFPSLLLVPQKKVLLNMETIKMAAAKMKDLRIPTFGDGYWHALVHLDVWFDLWAKDSQVHQIILGHMTTRETRRFESYPGFKFIRDDKIDSEPPLFGLDLPQLGLRKFSYQGGQTVFGILAYHHSSMSDRLYATFFCGPCPDRLKESLAMARTT